jgi:putative cell wall-binding protein
VTIIGGTLGVSSEAEAALRAAGCKVERVAGENFAETKAMLDKMAKEGKRFLTF